MEPVLHPKLSHLTDEQIEALIARYDSGANIKDLIGDLASMCAPPMWPSCCRRESLKMSAALTATSVYGKSTGADRPGVR